MDWMKSNLTTILITVAGIIGTFTVYGYRIEDIEQDHQAMAVRVLALETQQNEVRIQLAEIAIDIQYIKLSLEKLAEDR